MRSRQRRAETSLSTNPSPGDHAVGWTGDPFERQGRYPEADYISLRSGAVRTGQPVARLKPTGADDKVQVLWWNGERSGASGPFGIAPMPIDKALTYIAAEPDFWINA